MDKPPEGSAGVAKKEGAATSGVAKKEGSAMTGAAKKEGSTTSVAAKKAGSTTSVVTTKDVSTTSVMTKKEGAATSKVVKKDAAVAAELARVNASTRTEIVTNADIQHGIRLNNRKPVLGKPFIIVAVVVFALIVIAGVASFGLIFSQSGDNKSQIKAFEDHKTKNIESVGKAIKVVRTFSDLGKNINLENLSTEMSTLVCKQLDISGLNETEVHPEVYFVQFNGLLETINKSCSPSQELITDNIEIRELLNEAIEVQNVELKKVQKPIEESRSKLNEIIVEESNQSGRLSNQNIVGYVENMTTMLTDYQTAIVARDDDFIKSTKNQIAARDSAKLGHLITTIVLFSIALIFVVIIAVLSCLYRKQKFSLYKLELYSNILMGIAIIIAFALLILAILCSIGFSPFSYDCELKTPSQTSNKMFYTFDGKAVSLGKITGGCEKGSSVFTKMEAQLDGKSIGEYLDKYQSNVENFASTLHNFVVVLDNDKITEKLQDLKEQNRNFLLLENKDCLKFVLTPYNEIVNVLTNRIKDFNYLENLPPIIARKDMRSDAKQLVESSFGKLRNASLEFVGSINSQLKSTDIKCYQEMPHQFCNEQAVFSRNVMIVNWILFAVYALLAIFAKLLFVLPYRKMHGAADQEAVIAYLKERVGKGEAQLVRKNKNEIWYDRRHDHDKEEMKKMEDKVNGKEEKKKAEENKEATGGLIDWPEDIKGYDSKKEKKMEEIEI